MNGLPHSPTPSKKNLSRHAVVGGVFTWVVILSLLCVLDACRKGEAGLSPAQVHAITRELGAVAADSAPPGSDVRSEGRVSDKHPADTDHLYVTLAAGGSQSTRNAALARMMQSLTGVATRHGLAQDAPVDSGGLLRFSYRRGGRPTHTIHILFPIAARGLAAAKSLPAGHPRLAIILDDLGNDRAAADAIFTLAYPLTVSILPDHPHSAEIAEEAHRRGYEVMLHLPMQSVANEKPELAEVRPGLSSAEVRELVAEMLASVPYAAGVNNHQGSQATADPALMRELMPVLAEHRLFYIDSRTTAATVAYDVARRDGVRSAFRNTPFLDDVAEIAAVRRQLELAGRGARAKGEAIAIGHPHPATLQALQEMLPQLEAKGIRLVLASDLVH